MGDDEAFGNLGRAIREGYLPEDAVWEGFAERLGEGDVVREEDDVGDIGSCKASSPDRVLAIVIGYTEVSRAILRFCHKQCHPLGSCEENYQLQQQGAFPGELQGTHPHPDGHLYRPYGDLPKRSVGEPLRWCSRSSPTVNPQFRRSQSSRQWLLGQLDQSCR